MCSFSSLLTDVIGNLPKSCQITAPGGGDPQARDVLQYWDPHSDKHIDYGRYLTTKITGTPIDFWLGLDITKKRLRFIVWFEKKAYSPNGITPQSEQKLETALNNTSIQINYAEKPDPSSEERKNPSPREYWVTMDDPAFSNFCTTSTPKKPSHELGKFIEDILANL
jgi:hypothetical protein